MIYALLALLAVALVSSFWPAPRRRHDWGRSFANARSAWLQAEADAALFRRLREKEAGRQRDAGKVVRLETKQRKETA